MTYLEILRPYLPIIIAAWLYAALWAYRRWRALGKLGRLSEVAHLAVPAAVTAIGLLAEGSPWKSVLWNVLLAVGVASGHQSIGSAATADSITPEVMAELERTVLAAIRGKLEPTMPAPQPPPEHVAIVAPTVVATQDIPIPVSVALPSVIINVDHDGSEVQPVRLEPVPDKSLADTKDEAMPPVTLPTGAKP